MHRTALFATLAVRIAAISTPHRPISAPPATLAKTHDGKCMEMTGLDGK